MSTKKILTIIFSVLIIGVFAFLLTWGIINWSKVKEGMAGNGLYTKADIDNAYEDGYNTALQDKDEYDDLINEYRDTITTLTDNISQLNSELSALKRTNNSLELQITNLTLLRDKLEAQVEELSSSAEEDIELIEDLNRQILALNTKIENLNYQLLNHNAVVGTLNKTIADLQASIEYYEQYVASLENDQTVVVTFEFDGKVYSIQVVNKGSIVTVTNPQSTEGVIFNGWTVNGQPVNLATYHVNENTKFVADVSYKYVVSFSVDGAVKSTQLIDKGQYAEKPTSPKKANYTFKYWTLDGITEVELDKYPITCDTTFIAKFARLYTVSFQYADGTEIVSRRIEEGTTTNEPRIDLENGAILDGWTVNGVLVDVPNYTIMQDTVFVAKISKGYFTSMSEMTWNGLPEFIGYSVWSDGVNIYCNSYVLDVETHTWREMKWNGDLTSIAGRLVWTDGTNYYYSNYSEQYVLDVATHTWSPMTWNGYSPSLGEFVWTDGTNIYYSYSEQVQYVLNRATNTWSKMTWNGHNDVSGRGIWTDGKTFYYSSQEKQYVLDRATNTWSEYSWNGYAPNFGASVWTDGYNIYCFDSDDQYVLDTATNTWLQLTIIGKPNVMYPGNYVWTDGEHYYLSSLKCQYVLEYAKQ